MTITMNDSHLGSIVEIREFLKVSEALTFEGASLKEQYAWIETTLRRFRYASLRKKEKSIVKGYLRKMTGKSDAQMTRLIGRYRKRGKILPGGCGRHTFPTKYTPEDIALLVRTDNAHARLSGPATKRILWREYAVFAKEAYRRLKDLSVAHLYNLRGKRQYRSAALTYTKTQAVSVSIGIRKKPNPQGKPGYIRVDSVHQGDQDGEKGVYHINLVDEVTQWEIVGAVEKISEQYLATLLEELLDQFPFRIINFHSDNGSEYINKTVAHLLNKLLISQTKSRSRHCNDQALVEGKNGSVIRKHLGRMHIPQRAAEPINAFYREWFNPYLNYHRPSGFASVVRDRKGKERKRYDTYLTPFEKFRSLKERAQYLKAGVSWEALLSLAAERSDTEHALRMQEKKSALFQSFRKKIPAGYRIISGSYLD
jgi:transposase InsO family protein